MPSARTFRKTCNLFLPLLLTCICCQAAISQQPLVVFLVRHAEKVDDSKDPALTAAGKERSSTLATVLQDSKIQYVHSTNYVRTKTTAAPIAEKLALKINIYDTNEMPGFAQRLKEQGGRHLIVGHSNTTPKLVQLLGGKPGSIINDSEYDRLYILNKLENGETSTVLIRFGNPFESKTHK